jgi:soluble lytic murein transglycosylase-like protein
MGLIRHWITSCVLLFAYATFSPLLPQATQNAAFPANKKIESTVARQKAAVAAMASAVDRQTFSARHQSGSKTTGDFFTLPPPERLIAPAQVGLQPECDALPAAEVDSLIDTAAKREGVEPELIRGVMKQESGFRPCAVSPKGAVGLMQLMPQTAADLEVNDPFDPKDNVTAGTRLLRQLLQHYDGDLAMTLGAYNAGAARVDADMGVPAIPETMNYVQRILSFLPMAQMRALSFDTDPER